MRVLFLNPFSQEISGPDESLRVLLGALIPTGIEAHVVLPAPGPQVERYQALGAVVHFAPLVPLRRDVSVATATYPVRVAAAAIAVGRMARATRADLIHTNMEVLLEGGIAARALRIPHVLHYRGNTLDRPVRVFDALTAIWTGISDHVFCISKATAAIFEKRGRGGKVEVLYNPIDTRRFAGAARSAIVRHDLGATGDAPLIGTVGRIHPRKDIDTFLRAAARVATRMPEARFAIIGTAEAGVEIQYERRLRLLADELRIAERVTFAGPRRDIPEVMAALDVFVLTSRHEGFGRVVGEAMAAARPLVVSDEGAPPELVDHGRYGLCAKAGDAGDFGDRIVRLLANPGEAGDLGARARAQAAQFDAASIGARVRARYLDLVAGRPITRSAEPTAPGR